MAKRFKATEIPAIGKVDKVTQVKEFLKENFEIRINIFDPQKGEIKSLKREYKYGVEFCDVYLAMIEEGINASQSLLKTLITSLNQEHVKVFNPIHEYFSRVKGSYAGVSHIDKLCTFLRARSFGDKDDQSYQDRMKYLIKKWIVATAACALGLRQNDVALGFVNNIEGSGKTSLIKFLVPEELTDYYRVSQKDDKKFDIELEYTRRLIINFDELVGITKANAEQFKMLQSSQVFDIYRPGDTFQRNVSRIASAAFTSNKTPESGGFITPEMGYRRFAIIELDSIDKSYSKVIDVDQIWAEALMLINQKGYNYIFDEENYEDFLIYNARYIIQTTSYTVINENYEVPKSEADGIWQRPIDILKDLRRARKVNNSMNVSEITIGVALKALGFYKKAKRGENGKPAYYYSVKKLF